MEIHIPTLFLVIVAVSATLAISLGLIATLGSEEGLRYWAAAMGLHALTYVLYILRGTISDIASVVVANAMLAAAFSLFAEGVYRFQQRPPPRWLIWAPVIVIAGLFLLLLDDMRLRIILGGAIFATQCLFVIALLLQKHRETIGRGQYILAIALAIIVAMFIFRSGATMAGVAVTIMLSTSNPVQAVTFFTTIVCMILLSLGIVVMTKERSDERNRIFAIQDPMTGLANRRRLDEVLASEWARAARTRQPLTLAMIDVDYFKKYNDRHGHQAGDECLKSVARALQAGAQRAGDLVGRYGGEEFLLILADTDAAAARRLAEAVRMSIEALGVPHEDLPLGKLTVSIGVATLSGGSYSDVASLLHAADDALYRAKLGGRNQVHVAAPLQSSAVGRNPSPRLAENTP